MVLYEFAKAAMKKQQNCSISQCWRLKSTIGVSAGLVSPGSDEKNLSQASLLCSAGQLAICGL